MYQVRLAELEKEQGKLDKLLGDYHFVKEKNKSLVATKRSMGIIGKGEEAGDDKSPRSKQFGRKSSSISVSRGHQEEWEVMHKKI